MVNSLINMNAYKILLYPLMLLCAGCATEWDLPVNNNRHTVVKQVHLNNADSAERGMIAKKMIQSVTDKDSTVIERFDSVALRRIYGFGLYDSSSSKRKQTFVLIDKPRVILQIEKKSSNKYDGVIQRVGNDGGVSWEYRLIDDGREMFSILYVSDKVIVTDEIIDNKGHSYFFINPYSGVILRSTPPFWLNYGAGFNEDSFTLYLTEAPRLNREKSILYRYDNVSKLNVIAMIPNEFSGRKRAMGLTPILSFGNEKYIVLSIRPVGRSGGFSGFVVVDVETGEFLYKDHGEGGVGMYGFLANDKGDFVFIQSEQGDGSVVTHVKFD